MRPSRLLLLMTMLLSLAACKRVIDPGPEVLESFAVSFNMDPAFLTAQGCGAGLEDACPATRGSVEQPMPYAHSSYVSVFLDIEAIGSRGTRPFAWNGEVGVTLPRGQLHSQLDPIALTDGRAEAVRVRLRRVAGETSVLIEDRLDGRNEQAATYAVGGAPKLYFEHPTIAQVQETLDEGTSALRNNFVQLTKGNVFVTRVAAQGFNVQDVNSDVWNSLFIFAYNGVEGITVGSQLLFLSGSVTEFIGTTQLQSPTYAAPNSRCEVALGEAEGVEDTESDEGGAAILARCPVGTTCKQVEEQRETGMVRLHRCVLDNNPDRYDRLGRLRCSADNDAICPRGTSCTLIDAIDGVRVCLVEAVAAPAAAWPSTYNNADPYCGPVNTGRNPPLIAEMQESRLVKLTSSDGELHVEGLPVCKHVEDINSVRSSCHITDAVDDCLLARAGDRLLRDAQGKVCTRSWQACKDVGRPWNEYNSSCLIDETLDYCETALPGQPALRNDQGVICRSTMDDFILSGYSEYDQWKVTFLDENSVRRCATISSEALANFDVFALQENPGTLTSITGTLKQARFRSGASFWIIETRDSGDVVP